MIYWDDQKQQILTVPAGRIVRQVTHAAGYLGTVFADMMALRHVVKMKAPEITDLLEDVEAKLLTAYHQLQEVEIADAAAVTDAVNEANAALDAHVDGIDVHPIGHPDTRAAVLALTNGKCAYCDTDIAKDAPDRMQTFCVEHVVPRAAGGPDTLANYVPACMSCNSSKGDRHVLTLIRRMQKRHLSVVVDNPEREVIETAEGGAA